jgi:hypothetical protein
MKLHNFYTKKPKKGSKFIALYSDGSGANFFCRTDSGDYLDADGVILSQYWFSDSTYSDFAYLPNDYKLWFEVRG